MPLINCPECNYQISDKALVCPNCGFSVGSVKYNSPLSGESLQTTNIKLLLKYLETQRRNWELATAFNKSVASRLIWFVAISGYVTINLKPYFFEITRNSIQSNLFIWLLLPWIVTAMCAIITEFLLSIYIKRDSLYYTAKCARIEVFLVKESSTAKPEQFLAMFGEDRSVKTLKDEVNSIAKYVNKLEYATLVMLFISFFSLLVGFFIL